MSAPTQVQDEVPHIASGLSDRLRSLTVALDRLDRLESGSGEWLSRFKESELSAASIEMTLRALRSAADPINFSALATLANADALSMDQLIEATGVLRLTLSERLNDLVQVGLVSRNIDTDHVQTTLAGNSIVQLIKRIASEVSGQYLESQ
ncbi:MAG: hypothetical protein ACE5JF_07550 [Anaerolineales bacterium]